MRGCVCVCVLGETVGLAFLLATYGLTLPPPPTCFCHVQATTYNNVRSTDLAENHIYMTNNAKFKAIWFVAQSIDVQPLAVHMHS